MSPAVMETVSQLTPTITWSTPASITYGTPLSSTQLDATASVPGTFVYSPAAGTVLGAGTQTLNVTFTPTDTTDYTTATATTTLTVTKAMPTTTLTSTYNPSIYGSTVTLTATVTAGATGSVTFMDGSTTLATVPLNGSSVASYTTATLAAGTHNVTANYSGDSNFQ
jgi:hypothetical protein